MIDNIYIEELTKDLIPDVICLVLEVFNKYEAPYYTKEGVEEFTKFINDENNLVKLRIFGAFEKDNMIGVIATRENGTHIALFFVRGEYHGKGIGKKLFKTVINECSFEKMTVNSSHFAVDIYHKLGFCDKDKEQEMNGLRFTPMELKLKNE